MTLGLPAVARPEKWKDEFVQIATKACELGATDRDVAEMLGVSERTINNWATSKPAFAGALKVGKGSADERVKRSLYRRATGYSYDAEKVFQYQGQIIRAKVVEHVPPDSVAAFFWLKNRDRENWRDRQPEDDPNASPPKVIVEGGLPDGEP